MTMKRTQPVELNELQNQHSKACDQLYVLYYPVVEQFVPHNNGTHDDAQDVFQETMLVLLQKIPTNGFALTSLLKTYLFAVASNIWLKRLRQTRRLVRTETDVAGHTYEIQPEIAPQPTLRERLNGWLLTVPRHCQRLLSAFYFLDKTVDVIREEYGYSTVHSTRNQKYKCLQKLRSQPVTIDDLTEFC